MAKQRKNWPHKIRPVHIAETRVPPVGIAQRRFSKAQAEEYAADMDFNKIGVPALNQRGGIYWIVDGQHRIEALKIWFAPKDPGTIECSVYTDLTDGEMAELFIGLNTRRAVNRFDLFNISCAADRTREAEIRRVVEANGLRIKQGKETDGVSAVGALCRVYDGPGSVVLGQALRALRDGLPGDYLAFDGRLIRGTAHVFNRFNGKTDEKHLAHALAQVKGGAAAILRRADAQRERTGNAKDQCIAAAIVDINNRTLAPRDKHRLPAWWKEA